MKMKHIIIMAMAGIVSFGGSFMITRFLKQTPTAAAASTDKPPQINAEQQNNGIFDGAFSQESAPAGENQVRSMTEKQLQNLIYDLRRQIDEYNLKKGELAEQEKRITTTKETLRQDIEQLEKMRVSVAAILSSIKQQEDTLKKSTLDIESIEKTNLQRIAATYDKMDSAQASKIMLSMAANNQLADVVKIMYYMNERNAAKLLGDIGNIKPEIASALSLQLKRIKENG